MIQKVPVFAMFPQNSVKVGFVIIKVLILILVVTPILKQTVISKFYFQKILPLFKNAQTLHSLNSTCTRGFKRETNAGVVTFLQEDMDQLKIAFISAKVMIKSAEVNTQILFTRWLSSKTKSVELNFSHKISNHKFPLKILILKRM